MAMGRRSRRGRSCLRNLIMEKLQVVLSVQQWEVILNSLNQTCQGVQAAAQILPVFAEVEKQVKDQVKQSNEKAE